MEKAIKMTREEFAEFNTEMARLKEIKWRGYAKTLTDIGIAYLGSVAQSSKMMHSLLLNVSTYCIYLASADLSGYNVCAYSKYCKDNCLMGSGRNRINRLAGGNDIDRSRITKTRLFFANREVFMRLMCHEIGLEKKRAELIGNEFSIRINATSDLNPRLFVLNGKNILDIYKNVMIYDYTKVPKHLGLLKQYPNYDITWSIDGSQDNLKIGLDYMERGGRVAVVFGSETLPKTWRGYKVIDGDLYDFRYKDGNVVVGLKFKRTAENYVDGRFVMPNTDFIVQENDPNCEW